MILKSLSSVAQRLIAASVLLLLILVILLFGLLPVASGIWSNLGLLDARRAEQARAEAILASPAPRQGRPLDPQSWIHARSGSDAARTLIALVTGIGARRGVHVTMDGSAAPAGKPPVLLRLTFTAQGEQAAVLAFLGDIEAGRPLLRFAELGLQRQAVPPTSSTPPAAPSSAIAPQSPNLVDPMASDPQQAAPVTAENMTEPVNPLTMLQAGGTIMALWGGS